MIVLLISAFYIFWIIVIFTIMHQNKASMSLSYNFLVTSKYLLSFFEIIAINDIVLFKTKEYYININTISVSKMH